MVSPGAKGEASWLKAVMLSARPLPKVRRASHPDKCTRSSFTVGSQKYSNIFCDNIPRRNNVGCACGSWSRRLNGSETESITRRNTRWSLRGVLRNVQRYLLLLKAASNPRAVQAGFLHHEPMGVVAVDQKGGGGNLQETRLYTYADAAGELLYLITIGNKGDQPSDIEFSKEFVQTKFPPDKTPQ